MFLKVETYILNKNIYDVKVNNLQYNNFQRVRTYKHIHIYIPGWREGGLAPSSFS